MRRIAGLLTALTLVASACTGAGGSDSGERMLTAEFSRAVQIFPGNSVRVLGVTVGRVVKVNVTRDAAVVEMRIDDPEIELPADVEATLVPLSLLGERYVQLFPAYEGGPKFEDDLLTMDRTSVPAEQDELLEGLKNYFGAIDPDKVSRFVSNAATILDGNGAGLNRLIDKGSSVLGTLADKKDSLAGLITNMNRLTLTLSTRQDSIARLISTYNIVVSNLNENRDALEGTIKGLNAASLELASLLTKHRDPLGADVRVLTRTFRILARNADRFAETGKHAERLFKAAGRAVDYERHWLRLGNQGGPLTEMILFRLQDRLKGVCLRLGVSQCASRSYWAEEVPGLFCVIPGMCEDDDRTPGQALDDALKGLPDDVGDAIGKRFKKKCKDAKDPKRCREKKREQSEGDALDDLIDRILEEASTPATDTLEQI